MKSTVQVKCLLSLHKSENNSKITMKIKEAATLKSTVANASINKG